MPYVYVLLSLKDGKTYTGSTVDLDKRIQEHKLGKAKATRNRLPSNLFIRKSLKCLPKPDKESDF